MAKTQLDPGSKFFSKTLDMELEVDNLADYTDQQLRYAYADVRTTFQLRREKFNRVREQLGHPSKEDSPEFLRKIHGAVFVAGLWRKAIARELAIREAEGLGGESAQAQKAMAEALKHKSETERLAEFAKQKTERMAIHAELSKQRDRLFIEALLPMIRARLGDEAKQLFALSAQIAETRLKELEEQQAS
jgi:hypothetical protein